MQDIVLASSNPGKVREINQVLAGLDVIVRPQGDFNVIDAGETGLTFVENAILKVLLGQKLGGRKSGGATSVPCSSRALERAADRRVYPS